MVTRRYNKLAEKGIAYAHRDLASHLKYVQRQILDLCDAGAESVRVINAMRGLNQQRVGAYEQATVRITETFSVLQPFNDLLSDATEEIMNCGIMLLSKG
jgi:hypothetical protein